MDFAHWSTNAQETGPLADAVRRWIARDYRPGSGQDAWDRIAELGLTALPVPSAHGGFDGNVLDLAAVLREFGRGGVTEPYSATVLGAELLRRGGGHGTLLEQVAAGTLKLACALGERASRHDLRIVATRAEPDGDGWRLHGEKPIVVWAQEAGVLIVSARTAGSVAGEDGISLFAVPSGAPGLALDGFAMLDGGRGARVRLDGVRVDAGALVGGLGAGWDVLEPALDVGAALVCAESVGAMEALFDATLEYLKTRRQFGMPIGRFQALQHRMADMAIHLEQARSLALLAAVRAGGLDAAERRRAVSAAKYRVGQAGRTIGQQAVQLHGGMGVTDELPAARLFKRLTVLGLTLGDEDHHLARFIAQPGFADGAAAATGAATAATDVNPAA